MRRAFRRYAVSAKSRGKSRSRGKPSPASANPEIPDELVEAARRNELVLYVGSGLSAPAGFPTWGELVKRLLDWRSKMAPRRPELIRSWRASLRYGDFNSVADSMLSDQAITPAQLAG